MPAPSVKPTAPLSFDRDPTRSRTLPGHYYFDPAIFDLEKSKVFHHTWQYVGHATMLREPGSYITRNILDQSVLILRDRDGEIRAFFNVCQHRAHQLLKGEGRLASAVITCPYHAWTYDLAGQLHSARGAEKVINFDTTAIRLSPLRLGSFLGFLFVNLDGAAPPFEEVAGELASEVGSFSPHAANLYCAYRNEYALMANWKNSVENYSECFHCPISHRSLVEGALDYASYRVKVHRHHHSHRSRGKGNAQGYASRTETAAITKEFGSWLLWPNWCLEVYPGGNSDGLSPRASGAGADRAAGRVVLSPAAADAGGPGGHRFRACRSARGHPDLRERTGWVAQPGLSPRPLHR